MAVVCRVREASASSLPRNLALADRLENPAPGCRLAIRSVVLGSGHLFPPTCKDRAMSKIAPCLWFDGEAEEAAKFYASVFPNSRIERVQKNVTDSPAGKKGSVLVVDFTLAGQRWMALNGGRRFEYTHAISFKVDCADQAEVDRYWDALSQGGSVEQCGWLKDRYGISWQIVPTVLSELLGDADSVKAGRVMEAMLGMVKIDIAGLEKAARG
jgi:predicted 3-demethylubiquinone-9 3-methyltransferase (glyoxalase superfamily)